MWGSKVKASAAAMKSWSSEGHSAEPSRVLLLMFDLLSV